MRYFHAADIKAPGGEVVLSSAEADHLFVTLRGREGDRVGLLDGRGVSASAVVVPGRRLRVEERFEHPAPELRVRLFCAAPRRKELDLLLKQAAETGAWSVGIVECARSVALPDGGARDRWNAIVMEGCKQSRNFFAPELSGPEPLLAAVARTVGAMRCFFGSVGGAPRPVLPAAGDAAVFIGPEGGFTPEEESALTAAGVEPWNFAANVMRMETACACAVAIMNYCGDGR